MDYYFDGEIHPLSEDFAYIIKKVGNLTFSHESPQLIGLLIPFLKKYAEYLYTFAKEDVIEILVDNLEASIFYGGNEDVKCIYRPEVITDGLELSGTLSLKFKRVKGDNLSEKNEIQD